MRRSTLHLILTFFPLFFFCCNPENSRMADPGMYRPVKDIRPGGEWYDKGGRLIQAHGGGFLYDEGVYYWYGENKDTLTAFPRLRTGVIGISCYSSADLLNWEYHGLALPAVKEDTAHAMHPSKVAERPKVVYNELTEKYVMWLHIDDSLYARAHVGVAVADVPTGPFEFRERKILLYSWPTAGSPPT